MKRFLKSRAGSATIATVIASTLGVIGLTYLGKSVVSAERSTYKMRETLIANAYAEELLEYFLSLNADRLRTYLSVNPRNQKSVMNPTGFDPYPLCAPINLIDRNSNLMINRDTLADLPSDVPLRNANRFYRVEIVDMTDTRDLTKRRDLCGTSPENLNIGPTERLLVSVVVTWNESSSGNVERAVMSSVIPSALTYRPPPAVIADLKVNNVDGPVSISSGSTVRLSWTSIGATDCLLAPVGLSGTLNAGIDSAALLSTITYTLTCTRPGGAPTDTATDSILVNVTAPFGCNGSGNPVDFAAAESFGSSMSVFYHVALQPDGKIVAAGMAHMPGSISAALGSLHTEGLVVRFNANGTKDTSFNGTGYRILNFATGVNNSDVAALAIQSDGKILIAGGGLNRAVVVMRLNANGSNDTTFGTAGVVNLTTIIPSAITPSGSMVGQSIGGLLVQPDQKIVLSGGGGHYGFFLVRLNPTGTLDNTFDGDGIRTDTFGISNVDDRYGPIVTSRLLSDGKIVVLGIGPRPISVGGNGFVVARYLSNGTLDTTFGTAGKTLFLTSTTETIVPRGMTLQSDGKIVTTGVFVNAANTQSSIVIARLLATGQLDSSFGSSGIVTDSSAGGFSDGVQPIVKPDGKNIILGNIPGFLVDPSFGSQSYARFGISSYLPNGVIDTAWNVTGKYAYQFYPNPAFNQAASSGASAGVEQPDGKLIIVGHAHDGTNSAKTAIARFCY